MKYRIHTPNLLGDKKTELIDYLAEVHDLNFEYDESFLTLYQAINKIFDQPERKTSKNKLKKMFGMFFLADEFTAESFVDCCNSALELHDQADILRAKEVLGSREFDRLMAFPLNGMGKSEKLTIALAKNFYQTPEWTRIRYQALKLYKNYCQCCGAHRSEKLQLHVDHIIPRSIKPELALEISNLQILCANCNKGKSNVDGTDWRDQSEAKSAQNGFSNAIAISTG